MARRVAVVDDSEIVLMTVQMALAGVGWDVTTFGNEVGVSLRIEDSEPEVVLVDVNMPGLNGEGLIKSLKKLSGLKSAKLLLHSDQDASALKLLATKTGADGFIQKTGDPAELVNRIEAYL